MRSRWRNYVGQALGHGRQALEAIGRPAGDGAAKEAQNDVADDQASQGRRQAKHGQPQHALQPGGRGP